MPNQPIADLLARSFGEGFVHPGDGKTGPVVVPIAGYRTTGMPPQMADIMDISAKLLGEAIVHTIETNGDGNTIITNTELEQLRARADARPPIGARSTTFKCKLCDNKLFSAAIDIANPRLNGPQLANINHACPHGPVES